MASITEDKDGTLPGIFSQSLACQRVKALKAFAHIARLKSNRGFQTAGKAQHDATPHSEAFPATLPPTVAGYDGKSPIALHPAA